MRSYANTTYNISMYDVANSKRFASEKSVVVDIQNIKVTGGREIAPGVDIPGKVFFPLVIITRSLNVVSGRNL